MASAHIKRTIMDVLLVDGTEYLGVIVTLTDQLAAEETAGRHNWGGVEKSQGRMGAYAVYSALRRTGHVSGSFADFRDRVEAISPVDQVEVDPTPTSIPGA